MRTLLAPLLWTAAQVALFFFEPSAGGRSLCVSQLLGLGSCPGCGIGHAIHYALHGQLAASGQAHVLGIPATVLLLQQILQPLYKNQHHNFRLWTSNK